MVHFCVMGKGWRDNYIDLMAGVPQIADNLLQHSKSSALGQKRRPANLRRGSEKGN